MTSLLSSDVQDTEATKDFVRRFYGLWNDGRMAEVSQMVHPDYLDHLDFTSPPRETHGPDGFLADRNRSAQVLENIHVEIQQMIAEGNTRAVRVQVTADQVGTFRGIAPTGEKLVMNAISIFILEKGLLREHFEHADIIQPAAS